MTVTLSQKSYDALLDDLEKLRERNAELERKLDKEIKLSYEIEKNLYDTSKEHDELINDMAETKRKAEAFDEIDDLIVNGTLKDREPNAIFQNICHVIINLKERGSDE
ncbi:MULTISPECIES: hypothetical protein [Bacteria]|uniref:hypothetical protein n=1 Tax=Bacteria TaxID=2 RepID=UPI00069E8F15|nr:MULTISPECIES: hypothetical protein [Bacteria]MCC3722452.1 hypothetical protein [Staphylococcus haemolyticus]MCH4392948.1 hypothetical protein [Staphylococcus haemolyticus]MCH4470685.1 hypothetical protein [Staphylococcus haemolyticus]MCH4491767.1 hypothetical protein [Staphylococcus haemolyticus]MCH4514265.1 hypothetical protein [Staphylococcus haemolyticus]